MLPVLVDIVGSYYMDLEAGIFQLAFKIRAMMLRSKIDSVSKRSVKALTTKLVNRCAVEGAKASTKDPEFYFDELVRRGFLKPSTRSKYRFPMVKDLEFTYFKR